MFASHPIRPPRTAALMLTLVAIALTSAPEASANHGDTSCTAQTNMFQYSHGFAGFEQGVATIVAASCAGAHPVLSECQATTYPKVTGHTALVRGPYNVAINFCDSEADWGSAAAAMTIVGEGFVLWTIQGATWTSATGECRIISPTTIQCGMYREYVVGLAPPPPALGGAIAH